MALKGGTGTAGVGETVGLWSTAPDLRAEANKALTAGVTRESKFVSFLTPELERSADWVKKLHLSYVKTNIKLSGFHLYLVEEWLFDPSPWLYGSVLVHTQSPNDVVLCNVLRVTTGTTQLQHKLISDQFVHPETLLAGLSAVPVSLGTNQNAMVAVCDPMTLEANHLQLVDVVQGALQADVLQNVKTSYALRLFGCMQPAARLSSVSATPDQLERFLELYRGFLQVGLPPSLLCNPSSHAFVGHTLLVTLCWSHFVGHTGCRKVFAEQVAALLGEAPCAAGARRSHQLVLSEHRNVQRCFGPLEQAPPFGDSRVLRRSGSRKGTTPATNTRLDARAALRGLEATLF
jgi:hypothetical protein